MAALEMRNTRKRTNADYFVKCRSTVQAIFMVELCDKTSIVRTVKTIHRKTQLKSATARFYERIDRITNMIQPFACHRRRIVRVVRSLKASSDKRCSTSSAVAAEALRPR
jgi:hypothetical protein